jgi:hypothetical protein
MQYVFRETITKQGQQKKIGIGFPFINGSELFGISIIIEMY